MRYLKKDNKAALYDMLMKGGMMPRKYENGGPVGSASSDKKFRVIPEKSPTGQTELAYYIDGRPVESKEFQ